MNKSMTLNNDICIIAVFLERNLDKTELISVTEN